MLKEITIYDIAKEVYLSASSVSRALHSSEVINKKIVKRIIDKAEEMGYRRNNFASNLRNQQSHTISFILHRLNSYFITSVFAGIENITTKAGYDILITHSGENYDPNVANCMNLFQLICHLQELGNLTTTNRIIINPKLLSGHLRCA